MNRRQTELDDLTRRLSAMPLADQYEFAARVEQLLNLDQPLLKDKAIKRAASLEALRQAAVHLGVEGRPLKKIEYEQASRELGLMSWNKVHRTWDSFELGASVAAGARPPKTWKQRDFARGYVPRRKRFESEECFNAVRLWLASEPLSEVTAAFDDFVLGHNRLLEEGGLPLPRLHTVRSELALSFRDIVAIARGERPYDDVVGERRQREWTRGPHDLVTTTTVAVIAGLAVHVTRQRTRRADFPRPALVIRATQMWLREEVEAYFAGERRPMLEYNRLRPDYLTRPEAAELLALAPTTLHNRSYRGVDAVGLVGNITLYLRGEVEAHAERQAHEVARRRRERAQPLTGTGVRRSEFVTLMSLVRELGLSRTRTRAIVEQLDFPTPYRRFGGGIWRRADVEAYLAGRPLATQSAIEDLLLGTKEVNEMLGYQSNSTLRSKPKGFPRPVAQAGPSNVFARADIEAYLATDPNRRAQLDARVERSRSR